MKNRARIVSVLAALGLALLAPAALASVSRNSQGRDSFGIPTASLAQGRPLASAETAHFALRLSQLADTAAQAQKLRLFAGDELRPRPLTVFEASYPETRVGAFDFLGSPLVEVTSGVSHGLHWGCGDSWLGTSEGIGSFLSEDPLGDVDSPNLYAYVGWRPNEATDPTGEESVSTLLDPVDDLAGGYWIRGGAKSIGRDAWNVLTFGFLSRHDPALDAYEDGRLTLSEYRHERTKAIAFSGVGMAATALLPGVGGRLAMATGVTRVGSYLTGQMLGYGIQGAVIGGGSRLASDVAGNLLYDEPFSSPRDYAVSTVGGAFFNAVLGTAVVKYPILTRRLGGVPPAAARRAGWRVATERAMLAAAPRSPTGEPLCETCGTVINRGPVKIGGRLLRDWHGDHGRETWAQMVARLPFRIGRPKVIGLFQTGTRALCWQCNTSHRFEPFWRFISPFSLWSVAENVDDDD